MTLLEQLQRHKSGLIRIKTQLWWYGIGWDNLPGRVCLVLDARHGPGSNGLAAETSGFSKFYPSAIMTLLLIDGSLYWIRVVSEDVEFIDDISPIS